MVTIWWVKNNFFFIDSELNFFIFINYFYFFYNLTFSYVQEISSFCLSHFFLLNLLHLFNNLHILIYLHTNVLFYLFHITLLSQSVLKYIGENIYHVKAVGKLGIEDLNDFSKLCTWCLISTEVSWVILSASFSCILCLVHPHKHLLVLVGPWSFLPDQSFWAHSFFDSTYIPDLLAFTTMYVGLVILDITCTLALSLCACMYVCHLISTILKSISCQVTILLRLRHGLFHLV